jgi:O-antigen/teichoic acid export membrane protein
MIAAFVVMIGSVTSAFELLFHARMWMRRVALISVGGQVVQLACVVGLVLGGRSTVVWFTVPAVAASVVKCVQLAITARHVAHWTVAPGMWWAWMKEAAPLTLGGLLTAAYMGVDTLMLSQLDTFESVGLYAIGYKFADVIGSLPGAVMTPAFTIMVQAWPDDLARFRATFLQAFGLLVIVGAGLAVGFWIFAAPLIDLMYGNRFVPAAGAARLLVAGKIFNFFTYMCFSMLAAVGRHRLYPVAGLLGLVVNVGLNLVLIPRHSYDGAAWSTFSTEVVVLVFLGLATAAIPGVRPLPWSLIGRTVVAASAVVVVALAAREVLPWFVAAAVSAGAYVLAVHVLRVAGPGGLRDVLRPKPQEAADGTDEGA